MSAPRTALQLPTVGSAPLQPQVQLVNFLHSRGDRENHATEDGDHEIDLGVRYRSNHGLPSHLVSAFGMAGDAPLFQITRLVGSIAGSRKIGTREPAGSVLRQNRTLPPGRKADVQGHGRPRTAIDPLQTHDRVVVDGCFGLISDLEKVRLPPHVSRWP